MKNSSIKEMILKIRNQDMTVFPLLFDEFKRVIFFFANKSKVEDIEQELILFFMELIYDIDLDKFDFENDLPIKKYICVALRNKFIALSKLYRKNEVYIDNVDIEYFFKEEHKDNLFIYEALDILSYKQRVVMIYKYIYCYTDVEIGEMLGITRQAVNRIVLRSIDRLRNFYMGV